MGLRRREIVDVAHLRVDSIQNGNRDNLAPDDRRANPSCVVQGPLRVPAIDSNEPVLQHRYGAVALLSRKVDEFDVGASARAGGKGSSVLRALFRHSTRSGPLVLRRVRLGWRGPGAERGSRFQIIVRRLAAGGRLGGGLGYGGNR